MDEPSLRKLEEELMCPIHMEMFVDPMTLVCGHTLCRSDVDDMLERNADGLVRCPVCTKVSRSFGRFDKAIHSYCCTHVEVYRNVCYAAYVQVSAKDSIFPNFSLKNSIDIIRKSSTTPVKLVS